MQSKENKCNECPILNEFIDSHLMRCDTAFDLMLEVDDFIANCKCVEDIDDEEYCNL